nr:5-formyltetrahydrofolate cyclo-ligase [Streptomyces sp. AJS327]
MPYGPWPWVAVGSVAMNRAGVRVGKAAGYSDLEFAFLMEAGLISPRTVAVTRPSPRGGRAHRAAAHAHRPGAPMRVLTRAATPRRTRKRSTHLQLDFDVE